MPRTRSRSIPCALTIAGSDSGGGAGIQADLKTFTALGVHGATALTALTAQNPRRVTGVEAATPRFVRHQIAAVFEELPPAAAKTGMLFSRGIIAAVVKELASQDFRQLVVDPVMISTSGARLLQPDAIRAIQRDLLPRALLATPNLDEATLLTDVAIREPEDLRQAARVLHERYGCAALIKGGHLKGDRALDLFWDGREEWLLDVPRVKGVSSHGTGCTYSAAITALLALGHPLRRSIPLAKDYITEALSRAYRVGAHSVLEHRR